MKSAVVVFRNLGFVRIFCAGIFFFSSFSPMTIASTKNINPIQWTKPLTEEYLVQNSTLQRVGKNITRALAHEDSLKFYAVPFGVAPFMDASFWEPYGISKGGLEERVFVMSIQFPEAMKGSRIQLGDEVIAVEGKDIKARADYFMLMNDGIENKKNISFTFQRGQDQWIEQCPVLVDYGDTNFFLLPRSEKYAFVIDGPNIYVSSKTMRLIQRDQDLAFIIGHELSHIRLGHYASRKRARIGAAILTGIGTGIMRALSNAGNRNGNPYSFYRPTTFSEQAVGSMVGQGFLSQFEKKQEMQASSTALRVMHMAGYDPVTAVEFWRQWTVLEMEKYPEGSFDRDLKIYKMLKQEAEHYKGQESPKIEFSRLAEEAKKQEEWAKRTKPSEAEKDPKRTLSEVAALVADTSSPKSALESILLAQFRADPETYSKCFKKDYLQKFSENLMILKKENARSEKDRLPTGLPLKAYLIMETSYRSVGDGPRYASIGYTIKGEYLKDAYMVRGLTSPTDLFSFTFERTADGWKALSWEQRAYVPQKASLSMATDERFREAHSSKWG